MQPVPFIPDTAPFTAEQRAWLNGFLAGMFSRATTPGQSALAGTSSAPPALTPLTLLFGSQTGTAEGLAKRAAKEAGKRGFAPVVRDMTETNLSQLAAETNVLVIVSTYGDGEPPDGAKSLHAALTAVNEQSSLAALRYSVCALGDTNYVQFCQCGKDFDARLEKLGATRIHPRVDCDLDHEEKFTAWLDAALNALGQSHLINDKGAASAGAISRSEETAGALALRDSSAARVESSPAATAYSRQNPFPALLLTSRNLSGANSGKQVHHVEFSLADSNLSYEAGDALGVFPQNCPELVAELLAALGCDGEEAVPAADRSTTSLRRALTELYDLGKPSPELLAHYTPHAGGGTTIVSCPQVIDLVLAHTEVKLTPEEFVRTLRKLQPRLYSISSSPRAHAGQVHLTVGAVRYEQSGRPRKGVCSTFLADRANPGEARIGVFVHANKAFRLPASGDTPIIMIGPGTGIAPFRAFLHDRRATGARGKNWLLFGDQRAAYDFLYCDELTELQRGGTLTRLDLAWSRDQAEKVYVQHRLLEQAAELYAWLEAGAHIYVCGDASRMAKDVDAALHTVVERAGNKTREQAADYVAQLRATKRYARDVY